MGVHVFLRSVTIIFKRLEIGAILNYCSRSVDKGHKALCPLSLESMASVPVVVRPVKVAVAPKNCPRLLILPALELTLSESTLATLVKFSTWLLKDVLWQEARTRECGGAQERVVPAGVIRVRYQEPGTVRAPRTYTYLASQAVSRARELRSRQPPIATQPPRRRYPAPCAAHRMASAY
eukprot:COSAG02_NODE_10508_length_1924_cov_5.931544_1_plen_178_part_10